MNPNFIIYLSSKSVLDEIFLRDLSKGLQKWNKKAIIIHDPVKGPISQTWFQSKRISAHLSEQMVLNLPASAKDLGLFKFNPVLSLDLKKLQQLCSKVQFLVLNSIILHEKEEKIISVQELIQEIRANIGDLPVLSFPNNPLSPLGQTPYFIGNENDYDKIKLAYPEEIAQIDWLFAQKPSYFVSPTSISQIL